ncbi:MAG: single-stranded DNA-binding protein [Bacteroidota bacterium]|nr:single-stranded DNA-binding protein [Bacteroidota bacterium]
MTIRWYELFNAKILHHELLKNKVQLIGHLGNDPEMVTLENGNKLAKFSLATNETFKNAEGEKVTDTQWHNIVAWGKIAEIAENYLAKGKEIMIEGKLMSRAYETKEGEKRYITEIKCNELLMLGK